MQAFTRISAALFALTFQLITDFYDNFDHPPKFCFLYGSLRESVSQPP